MATANQTVQRQSLARRLGGIVLGAFILWQLFYLAVANSLETVEVAAHRFPKAHEAITNTMDRLRDRNHPQSIPGLTTIVHAVDKWGELTEQPQRWSLFAPNIGDQSGFLACELRWDGVEDSYWLKSDNEPEDKSSYFRLGGNRLRSIEQNLVISFDWHTDESEQDARRRWSRQIQQKLARDYDMLITWISLRVNAFLEKHPDVPMPDEVLIHIHGYQIASPDSQEPVDGNHYGLALARWTPGGEYPAEVLPIEAFDPVTEQFVFQPWDTETE